jgi:hypothetical protein
MIIQMDSSSKHKKEIRRIILRSPTQKCNFIITFGEKKVNMLHSTESGKIKALAALAESNISPGRVRILQAKTRCYIKPCPFAK